jgi:hypothetical protein
MVKQYFFCAGFVLIDSRNVKMGGINNSAKKMSNNIHLINLNTIIQIVTGDRFL